MRNRSTRNDDRHCKACGLMKSGTDFYPSTAICKPCVKKRDATRADRTGIRRNDTDAARARKRKWASSNTDPLKQSARREVRAAVLAGTIQRRAQCEECGQEARRSDGVTAVQAHHDDYSKPLNVRWLCSGCHSAWHRINDAARAATSGSEGEGRG